jgi:hypothetical protein
MPAMRDEMAELRAEQERILGSVLVGHLPSRSWEGTAVGEVREGRSILQDQPLSQGPGKVAR